MIDSLAKGLDLALSDGAMALTVVAGILFAIVGLVGFMMAGGGGVDARRKRIGDKGAAREVERRRKGLVANLLEGESGSAARRRALSETKKSKGLGHRLAQAGLEIKPPLFLAIFALAGAVVGVAALIVGAPLPAAAGAGVLIAFAGPGMVIGQLTKSRRQKFVDALPGSVDIMVRGVQAGLPVNEGLKVIVNEAQGPLRVEFARLVAATNVGFSLEEAVNQMADRVPSPEVNFFRVVLVIQKQTGGNLAEALGNLSSIIRERQKLNKKVWALSSEARSSAMIIGALPLVVAGGVAMMRPDYLQIMFVEELGNYMLAGAVGWMLIGVVVMRAMIKIEV